MIQEIVVALIVTLIIALFTLAFTKEELYKKIAIIVSVSTYILISAFFGIFVTYLYLYIKLPYDKIPELVSWQVYNGLKNTGIVLIIIVLIAFIIFMLNRKDKILDFITRTLEKNKDVSEKSVDSEEKINK